MIATPREADTTYRSIAAARGLFYVGTVLLGLVAVRPLFGLTLSDLAFFGALLALVGAAVLGHVRLRFSVPVSIVVGTVLFAVGGLLSSTRAADPTGSAVVVARLVYLTLVWFWLGMTLLDDRRHVRVAIACWVASAAINGVAAVVQLYFGNVIPGTYISPGRMSGFTQHVNDLGALSAIALVPALYVGGDQRNRRAGALAVAGVVLVFTALVLSGSVGAWIAATAATLAWLLLAGRRRPSSLAFLGVAVLSVLLLLVIAQVTRPPPFAGARPSPVGRITSVTSNVEGERPGSMWERIEGYRQAWDRIRRDPLVGAGLDPVSAKTPNGIGVHNVILGAWYQAGILGLLGMLAIVGGVALRVVATLRRRADEMQLALVAASVAFGAFVMGAPIVAQRYAWIAPALLLASAAQRGRGAAPADAAARRAGVREPPGRTEPEPV